MSPSELLLFTELDSRLRGSGTRIADGIADTVSHSVLQARTSGSRDNTSAIHLHFLLGVGSRNDIRLGDVSNVRLW